MYDYEFDSVSGDKENAGMNMKAYGQDRPPAYP